MYNKYVPNVVAGISTPVCTESTVTPFLEVRRYDQTSTKKMLVAVFPAYGVHHVKWGNELYAHTLKINIFIGEHPGGR